MNFHLQSKKRAHTKRTKLFLIIGTLVAVVLLATNYFTHGVVSASARSLFASLYDIRLPGARIAASVQHVFTSKQSLIAEQEQLKARVQELEIYALNNIVLATENKELRELLGTATTTHTGGVVSTVLSNGGVYPYGTIVVTNPQGGLLQEGQLVFGAQNILLGIVQTVDTTTSLVRLISAPSEETEVLIGADDRITAATLHGIGNGNMTAEIVRDADIRVGDPVVYVAQETAVIGVVGAIEAKPADAFQLVRVRTPYNLSTIRFVHIR